MANPERLQRRTRRFADQLQVGTTDRHPDRAQGVAHLQWDRPGWGPDARTVALTSGDCGDYRAALKADFTDPLRFRSWAAYAAACKEKTWPFAYADPANYAPRAVQGLWQSMGASCRAACAWAPCPRWPAAGSPRWWPDRHRWRKSCATSTNTATTSWHSNCS